MNPEYVNDMIERVTSILANQVSFRCAGSPVLRVNGETVQPRMKNSAVTFDPADPEAHLWFISACASGVDIIANADTRIGPTLPDGGPWLVLSTSGSTGKPKLLRRTHASWIASFQENSRLFGVSEADRYAVLGRMEHSLTLYAIAEAMYHGAGLEAVWAIRMDRQLSMLRDCEATVLYATPAQIRQLRGAPALEMRLVMIGGGMLDAGTAEYAAKLFPSARLVEFYGTAEASFISYRDASLHNDQAGQPYPNVQMRIADGGELKVKSPYTFNGYNGDLKVTEWVYTGDVGTINADGDLHLHGRVARSVQVLDQMVNPERAEIWIAERGVRRVAVVALPDQRRGARLIGFIQGSADPAPLLSDCRRALGPVASPQKLIALQDWPELPSGKTDLAALTRRAEALQ